MEKYIIFDIDDTLVETFINSYNIFCEMAKIYKCWKIDQKEFLEQYMKWNFDNNLQHFFWKIISINKSKKLYEETKKKFQKKKLINTKYFEKLLKNWYKIWILTNWPEIKTNEKLKYLWVDKLCSIVFHEWNMQHKKPDSKVFDDIYSVIWTNKVSIIYIGDALVDYFATVNTNVTFYPVLTGYTTEQDFIEAGIDKTKIYKNINVLLDELLQWTIS